MKDLLYFFILAFLLLILESTLLHSVFKEFFSLFGLGSLSYFCIDTTFVLCIYIALTKKFDRAFLFAFVLGYLKDVFILSNSWINPFLFVVCALVSNILKRAILLKGVLTFMTYMFFISMFYCFVWMIVTYNLAANENAFMIGLYVLLPNSLVNAIFSSVLYVFLKEFDLFVGNGELKRDKFLMTRW